MKLLSKEEISVLDFAKVEVQAALYTLEVGQGLAITKEEWTFQTRPSTLLYSWAKRKGFKVSVKRTPAGWVVVRKA